MDLISLMLKYFSDEEQKTINKIIDDCDKPGFRDKLAQFDLTLGNLGINNVTQNGTGVYLREDREIFRVFQYIEEFFDMDYKKVTWLTRTIVQYCGLHLEGICKTFFSSKNLTLGRMIYNAKFQEYIGEELFIDIEVILKLYNNAKHDASHEKDTHYYDIHNAVWTYFCTRKISNRLLNIAEIKTNLCNFNN